MDYLDKGVVITGGASGIGYGCAMAFIQQGASVLLSDVNPAALDKAVSQLNALGVKGRASAFPCDVSKLADVEALADHAFANLASVDVVFCNAGVGVSGPIASMSHADWQWVMGVNLWGAIHGAEVFPKRLIAQNKGGQIVFNASFAGLVYSPTLGPYCASKAGVVALAEVLRQEIREQKIGVSVVCPMRIATDIGSSWRNRPEALSSDSGATELIDPSDTSLPGEILSIDEASKRILAGIGNNDLYIMTHGEGRSYVRRRFEKVDKGFEVRFAE
ncbi:MAG: NAD(P)-dependent dehydrogenase (short-subunit alcohol dehydrogenase family) [Marinomonas primoryensis]|jgi:NAD(P)-dependent dehydrogenase (short-subunit alcohol dehydrogenase family)